MKIILKQDLTLNNFLPYISHTDPDEDQINIAQNVYQQSLGSIGSIGDSDYEIGRGSSTSNQDFLENSMLDGKEIDNHIDQNIMKGE